MRTAIVIDHQQEWFEVPDAAVLTARRYLAEPDSASEASVRVLNLCRTGRYQGRGYYVSLLAEARGQRPLPDVKTVQDLKSEARVRALSTQLEPLVRETLHHDESDRFELNVYFGKDPAERHAAIAEQLFANVRAPLLRALFERAEGRWRLNAVDAVALADIPAQHRAFLLDAAKEFIAAMPTQRATRPGAGRPRLAILRDQNEPHKPSNDEALERLVRTAPLVGLEAELI